MPDFDNMPLQETTLLNETSNIPNGPWQILRTSTKASFDTNISNLTGQTFYRVKAQKIDLVNDAVNVVVFKNRKKLICVLKKIINKIKIFIY